LETAPKVNISQGDYSIHSGCTCMDSS
jgi:hypothetical protein